MAKTQEQDDFGVSVRLEGSASEARVILTQRCDSANLSVQLLGGLLRQHDAAVGKHVAERLRTMLEGHASYGNPR